ncbi:hypothetical protein AAHC03_016770 [Spirometra sp. Aus1]
MTEAEDHISVDGRYSCWPSLACFTILSGIYERDPSVADQTKRSVHGMTTFDLWRLCLFFLILILWVDKLPLRSESKLPTLSPQQLCGDGELSPYHKFVEQYRWVDENYTDHPSELSGQRSTPLIYYSNRILYHPVFTGGCAYKCRYSHRLSDLRRAQLAVFTHDIPAEAYTVGKGVIWAFESGEPIHLLPSLSDEAKKRISMYITHHTFAAVTYYYGFYWAYDKPECLMSKAARLRLKSQNSLRLLPDYHFQRTKKIAWVVSNKKAPNRRMELADAINQYMQVDKYGRGLLQCPHEHSCFDWLTKNYKFYLSFENCHCEGYITEKFFSNALRVGMVPIVYGPPKDEYEARAPPNSFIHVDDFATVNDLIGYLDYLDHNDTAYATYFAWREHGRLLFWPRIDCRVCGVLHQVLDGKVKLKENTFDFYYDKWRTCMYDPYIRF